MNLASTAILAEAPDPGGYTSIFKIVYILIWFFLFIAFSQWVNADTRVVRAMSRNLWNSAVLGTGTIATAIWLFGPWQSYGLFFAGWGIWLILTGGVCTVYVVLRNRFVAVNARVFTKQHIAAQFRKLFNKKEKTELAVERVNVTCANGKKMPVPDNPEQIAAYEAVQTVLFDALWRRATDVILAVSASKHRLIYKIDGVSSERADLLTQEVVDGAFLLLKQVAGLNPEERRKPQSGRIKAVHPTMDRTKVEMEVKSSGTREGERIDIRLITQESRVRLPDLGLNEQQLEQFEKLIQQPGGLVIVSGPKASGVTTTLYAALRAHDAFLQNLHTIERSPLMELENITQNKFDPTKPDVSYARHFQTILRREPDVVMVGECMDRETAHLAAKAAIDGKKIYVGIPAKDSVDALKKFVSLCADSDVASAALAGISSQRLIRKLCPACREAYKPDAALLKKANIPAKNVDVFYRARTEPVLDKKGRPVLCTNCQGSGHYGRVAVFELMIMNDAIRELIRNGQPANVIQKECRKSGMQFLQEVGVQLVIKGVTSMNEIIRGMRDEESAAPVGAVEDSSED